jgi:1-acyl-sn-glycerol-3-phosphate acyltransferase
MLRTLVAVVRTAVTMTAVAIGTIVLGGYLIILTRFRPVSRQIEPVERAWARIFGVLGGVRFTIEGIENIDPEASYLFTPNHLSNLDAPFHIATLPARVRFLAKKELFRIPVFGLAMRSIGMVETDRQAGAGAHRRINEQVAKVMQMKRSLVIYPEGTRSRDAELHPFKKGAFRIAIDNQLPVVPVTISGTERAWKPGSWLIRSARVKMILHPPIPTVGMGEADIDPLRLQVHRIIDEAYARIRRES